MIAKLVTSQLTRRKISAFRPCLHQSYPLFVIHNVERLAFQRHCSANSIPTAKYLNTAKVDAFVYLAILLPHSADPLPRGVVDIESIAAAAQIYVPQMILKIPAHR